MRRYGKKGLPRDRMIFWILMNLSVNLTFILSGFAQDASRATLIRNVRLFDGERLVPKRDVLFFHRKIVKVGKEIVVPEDAEVVEGNGKTLLPGFIDAHVHIWAEQHLKQSMIFGVTTVVDMFMSADLMKQIKKIQSSGEANDMASLISPGILATAPGGHGTQYGLDIPTLSKPEEAEAFVNARIAEGSDFIKIIWERGSGSKKIPTLTKETIKALIDAAHRRHKLAIVHISTLQDAMDVMDAGADGLAHLYLKGGLDPQFGKMAAEKGTFVIPTFCVLESIAGITEPGGLIEDTSLSPYITPTDVMMLKQTFPHNTGKASYQTAEKALRQLKSEKVPILAGTDAPNPGTTYGASLHRELELLVQAGLSPIEALTSATSITADMFRLKDRGRIKPGLAADLVLVEGDPTREIKATRNIAAVWKNGVKVDREIYQSNIEKEKLAAEKQKDAPPPEGSEPGSISDFETGGIDANFGAGWSVSTDEMMGGKSTAEINRVQGGAQGSQGSLSITGTIREGSQYQWAGAFFSPGKTMMAPANLSSKKSIRFYARGDGKTYSVMIFAQSLGFTPATQNFESTSEWKEYTFSFEMFNTDGSGLMGIFIGGASEEGDFRLQVDNVRVE